MNKPASAPGKPAGVTTIGNRPAPGAKPTAPAPGKPASIMGGVKSRERPGALPVPASREVSAFSPASVLDRWNADAAGIRPAALEAGDNVITIIHHNAIKAK